MVNSPKSNYAVPSQPINIQRLCTVAVWQAPFQPNGVIIGYDLEFSHNGQTSIRSLDTGANFYITTQSEREAGTSVRVSIIVIYVTDSIFLEIRRLMTLS